MCGGFYIRRSHVAVALTSRRATNIGHVTTRLIRLNGPSLNVATLHPQRSLRSLVIIATLRANARVIHHALSSVTPASLMPPFNLNPLSVRHADQLGICDFVGLHSTSISPILAGTPGLASRPNEWGNNMTGQSIILSP
jgi:hypothetical protein